MRRLIFGPGTTSKVKTSARRRPRRRNSIRRVVLTAGIPLSALSVAALSAHWAWQSGWLETQAASTMASMYARTAQAGLSVQDVLVEGRERTAAEAMREALEVGRGTPILAFDPARARDRLEALPWIKKASVERQLPQRIYVRVREREPMAVWQHRGRYRVIDTDGVVIEGIDPVRFAKLPLVVGEDAPAETARLLAILQSEPGLARRVAAAVRVSGRRWNVRLDNGVDVQLPEERTASAWAQLARLESRHALLQRDVHVIDLRLPDRLVVRTSPGTRPSREEPVDPGQRT